MQIDEYLLSLGKLVSNLHSLEFALRAFLLRRNEGLAPKVDVAKLAAGDMVPINSFTSYASLGELVDTFNRVVQPSCPSRCLDRTVVELRDMIAHGRVAGRAPNPPFELLKFGREKAGQVPVEYKITLDRSWLSSKIRFVNDQIQKVFAASRDLTQNIMDRA